MSGVRVEHTLAGLEADMRKIPVIATRDMRATIRQAGIVGRTVARDNARRTAGRHGRHYPKVFTSDTTAFHGFGSSIYVANYGPDADMVIAGRTGAFNPGDMASGFEKGSRNQPAHNDLAKSADLMGPALASEVRRLPDNWFWPGRDT